MDRPVGGKLFHDDRRRGCHDDKLILRMLFCLYFKKKYTRILIFSTSATFINYRR
jgi:hypothetical protein